MLPDGKCLNEAFVYDWRIWQIREVREVLTEAGFEKNFVLWEKDDDQKEGSGEFYLAETAENAKSWVAYIVGIKE